MKNGARHVSVSYFSIFGVFLGAMEISLSFTFLIRFLHYLGALRRTLSTGSSCDVAAG